MQGSLSLSLSFSGGEAEMTEEEERWMLDYMGEGVGAGDRMTFSRNIFSALFACFYLMRHPFFQHQMISQMSKNSKKLQNTAYFFVLFCGKIDTSARETKKNDLKL